MTRHLAHDRLDIALTRAAAALSLAEQIDSTLRSLAHPATPACLWRTHPAFRFNDSTT